MPQTAIASINELRYENYYSSKRYQEATDIAERLGYPINHTISYRMHDGLAYARFDTSKSPQPFRMITDLARREAPSQFNGPNQFEAQRRELEHQEALLVDKFGRGELNANLLFKISPVPDAVMNGSATIEGYQKRLARSFIRIYWRKDSRDVNCSLFSIDGTTNDSLRAIGDLIEIDVRGQSSEDILADYSLQYVPDLDESNVEALINALIEEYDSANADSGTNKRAGSKFIDKNDALSAVMVRSDVLDRHIRALEGKNESEKKSLRERAAAEIALLERSVDSSDISSDDIDNEVASGDYSGYCSSSGSVSATTLEQAAMSRGKNRMPFKSGRCQACLKVGLVGECSVCKGCEELDNSGVNLLEVRRRALAKKAGKKATDGTANQSYQTKSLNGSSQEQPVIDRPRWKSNYSIREKIIPGIGGGIKVYIDKYGNIIDRPQS